jgi:hypothetical protein
MAGIGSDFPVEVQDVADLELVHDVVDLELAYADEVGKVEKVWVVWKLLDDWQTMLMSQVQNSVRNYVRHRMYPWNFLLFVGVSETRTSGNDR